MLFQIVISLVISVTVVSSNCPTSQNVISLSDVKNAVRASSVVYFDHINVGSTIKGTSFKVVKKVHKTIRNGEGIRALVADHGNTRIIAYRGTDGAEQLMQQLASFFSKRAIVTFKGRKTKVLKFFWEAFESVSYELRPYITNSAKKYILTGHSLGGALASLLAIKSTDLFSGAVWKNPQSSLITFGQPRVGDSSYANAHDAFVPPFRKLRVIYQSDPVAHIPPYLGGFRHHSRAIILTHRLKYTGWGRRKRNIPEYLSDNLEFNDDNDGYENDIDNHEYDNYEYSPDNREPQTTNEDEMMEKGYYDYIGIQADENAAAHIKEKVEYVSQPSEDDDDIESEKKNVPGKNHKRFLYNTVYYWQVCSTKDALTCAIFLIPNFADHKLTRYESSINDVKIYRTTKSHRKLNLGDALIATCNGQ